MPCAELWAFTFNYINHVNSGLRSQHFNQELTIFSWIYSSKSSDDNMKTYKTGILLSHSNRKYSINCKQGLEMSQVQRGPLKILSPVSLTQNDLAGNRQTR